MLLQFEEKTIEAEKKQNFISYFHTIIPAHDV